MAEIFKNITVMTLTGSILTLIVLAVLPVTKRLLSPKWHCRLLSVVLTFFLLPVGAAAAALIDKVISMVSPVSESSFAEFWDEIPAPLDLAMSIQAQANHENTTVLESILPLLPFIWITGAVLFLIFKISQLVLFKKLLAKSNEEITDSAILDIFERVKKELNISDTVSLWRNSCISTPVIMGLNRTGLLLPQIDLSGEELELVLRHELIHYRNRDLWAKFAAMTVCAIHWFNPLVYALSNSLERFLEMSCDADVVKEMDYEQRSVYAATILNILDRTSFKQPNVYAAFSSNKNAMKGRLTAMLNGKKPSKRAVIFSALSLIFVCAAGVSVSAALSGEAATLPPLTYTEAERGASTYTPYDSAALDEVGVPQYAEAELSQNEAGDWYESTSAEQIQYYITVAVPLPKADKDVLMSARINDELVAEATINLATYGSEYWSATFLYTGEREDAMIKIYADKILHETIALNTAENVTARIVDTNGMPNPLDFAEGTLPVFESFLWPTEGGRVSAGFNAYPGHTGMDIAAPLDTPVFASAPGIVTLVKHSNVGYGNHIVIDHGDGYQTLYAHCKELTTSVGDAVEAGQTIAVVGRTGNTTGYNLHFEVRRNGKVLNPADLVNADNIPMELPQA